MGNPEKEVALAERKQQKAAEKAAKAEAKAAQKAERRAAGRPDGETIAQWVIALALVFILGVAVGVYADGLDVNLHVTGEGITDTQGDVTTDPQNVDNTDPTDDPSGNDVTDPGSTDDPGTTGGGTGTTGGTGGGTGTTTKAPSGSKMPTTTAEIVSYFNTAANKIKTNKPGIKKTEQTQLKDIKTTGSIPGSLLNMATGLMNSDPKASDRKKGQDNNGFVNVLDQPWVSKLTANDVKSATCKVEGKNYVIRLEIKDEANPAPNGGSAHGRALTVYTAQDLKKELDAISTPKMVVDTSKTTINYSGSYIICKIDIATGNVTYYESMATGRATTKDFQMSLGLLKGTGDLSLSIVNKQIYKDFVW